MNLHALHRQLTFAFAVATLALAARSHAQIIPLVSEREIFAQATIDGLDTRGNGLSTGPDQFDAFIQSVSPHLEEVGPCDPPTPPDLCTYTVCDAYAGQNSSIFSSGIQFSGEGSGAWDGETSSRYKFRSICKIRFRLDIPVDYTIQLYADNGDLPPGTVFAALEGPTPDITFHYTQYGVLETTGTLGPGEYVLRGETQTDFRSEQFTSGGAYSAIFFINPIDTLGGYHGLPVDQTVACGGTATFSIASPGPGLSYQWRHGLTPLTNSSHISGANSPTLTINGACTADAGSYSVVATVIGSNPVITIPSRFANLAIVTTPTGVATDDVTPARVSSFLPAAPNPFRSETALRYTVPPSTRVVAAVYDAAGTRVRGLTNAVLSGSGSIAWDGRTQAGERAPAGVYFVHLEAGSIRETKKVVLVR